MITKNRIEVSTREYEFSHGKSPRGNGFWLFDFRAAPRGPVAYTFHSRFAESYRDAKAAAITAAALRNLSHITVCP